MNLNLLAENLTNPALLFFILGIISVQLKSDLEIPKTSSKFISLYLLFAIGFKGGQELAHSTFTADIIWSIVFGIGIAVIIPCVAFFILKRRLSIDNSGAIAAALRIRKCSDFRDSSSVLRNAGNNFWRTHGGCHGIYGSSSHCGRCDPN